MGLHFMRRGGHFDPEILIAIAVLCAAAVIGLITVGDYGITVDEWNADDYGRKALAWYASGFRDRAMFNDVEDTLWYYGPWFHILTSFIQSLGIAEHWTTRHAMTFLSGLAAIAMLLPLARSSAGRWSGLAAIVLCLTTGYFYGSIFFTPIDVPFVFAMTAATLAIVTMAKRIVPTWPATVSAGLLIGLAMATRSSGAIAYAYLIGAMVLCAVEAILGGGGSARQALAKIGMRTLAAGLLAWLAAIALWPWLQIANPFTQFAMAFTYFANHPKDTEVLNWGELYRSNHLPWSYIPEQLAARLPEGFLLLLAVGLTCGLASALALLSKSYGADRRNERLKESLKAACLAAAQSRQVLVVWAAALLPIAFVMVQGSTLYDGIRHVLFLIPILAVIAGCGFVRLLPYLGRFPVAAAATIAAYLGYQVYLLAALHPLQYVAFNAFAGGVQGAYQRFDMDYWSVGATVALRRLEHRLDREPGRFKDNPPSLMICITWRENMVEPMYRRPWRLETDPAKADYVIATERMKCADNLPFDLIDEVKRLDRVFAWTYAGRPRPAAAASPSAASAPR